MPTSPETGASTAKLWTDQTMARRTRADSIMEMRLAGWTTRQIGEAFNLTPQRVGVIISREEKRLRPHTVERMRGIENRRLDAMQTAFFSNALGGNVFAAGVVLQIMNSRARLNGLNVVTAKGRDGFDDAGKIQQDEDPGESVRLKLEALSRKMDEEYAAAHTIEGTVVEDTAAQAAIDKLRLEAPKDGDPAAPVELPVPDPIDEFMSDDIYGEKGIFDK